MKGYISLFLTLCVLLTAMPAFAETAADNADSDFIDRILSLLGVSEGSEETVLLSGLKEKLKNNGKLGSLLSGLKDKLKGGKRELALVISSLTKKFTSGDSRIHRLFSGLSDKLKDGKSSLKALLNGLLGRSGSDTGSSEEIPGMTPEEEAELQDLLDKLSEAEEAGERPINKKEATGVEEFFGEWIQSAMYIGEDYTDLRDSNEGVIINENGFFFTENGETEDGYPEKSEMKIENGELKVQDGDTWSSFILTEEDELVLPGIIQIYFTRIR